MWLKRSPQNKEISATEKTGLRSKWSFIKFQKLGAWRSSAGRYAESCYSSDSRPQDRENPDPALKTLEANGELNQSKDFTKPRTRSTTEQVTQLPLYRPNKRKSMPLNEDKFTYFCLHLNVLLHKMFTIRSNNKEHKIVRKSDPYEKKQPMGAYPKMVQIIELFDKDF